MYLSIIAAMTHAGVIGKDGRMPWHISSDRRQFRKTTMGHPVIFGRKTYEAIGYPLEGRKTIVLTRNMNYRRGGVVVVHSLDEAVAACAGTDEAFIGGGESLFRQIMPFADRIYLTVIHADYEGDAFFPNIPLNFVEKEHRDVADEPAYTLLVYEREGGDASHD